VRKPTGDTHGNETNAYIVDGNDYSNVVIVPLSQDKHNGSTDTGKDRNQPLYEDLNTGGSVDYEKIRPPVLSRKSGPRANT